MALKDLLKLSDAKLEADYNRKPHDPNRDRAKAIKGIDRVREQFAATEPVKGKKWWSAKNNVVAFTPPFLIGDQITHYIPSERFTEFLDGLVAAINAGELDAALLPAEGTAKAATPRKRAEWSPERKAKQAAAMKASWEKRNAKK